MMGYYGAWPMMGGGMLLIGLVAAFCVVSVVALLVGGSAWFWGRQGGEDHLARVRVPVDEPEARNRR